MLFIVIFLSVLLRVFSIFNKETIPLHKLCTLDSFGTECILQSLITTSLVPGDKLGIRNVNLDAIDSSNLIIPLSNSFIDSYFFITFECDIAYSNSWFIFNTDFFEELVLKSPSSYFVLISSTLNCSNYNHSSIGIRTNLKRLDKEILNKIYVLKYPLLLSVDLSTSSSTVNDDDNSGIIFEWLRSWSTLWRPTLQILSISSNSDHYLNFDSDAKSIKQTHLFENELYLYQYLDASGTSGWGNNNILQTNSSCENFNKGVCGNLKYVGDACSSINKNSSNNIALVIRGTCAFTLKARNVQNAGFIGLIIFDNNQGRIIMGGNDGGDINIPVFMIDYEPGWNLQNALETKNASIAINLRMFNRQAPMAVASLDRLGRVSEIGSIWSNTSDAIISQAIYQNYYYELQLKRIALANTTSVVSITDNFYWWSWDIIQIPTYLHYSTFSKLHLYFDAKCIRGWDNSCPEWDKLLSLYMCLANTTDSSYPCIGRQIEIVRSITSYSRGYAGLIDISHLLFFFSEVRSQSGSLHGIKIWGGRNYYMTLTLYFSIARGDGDGDGDGVRTRDASSPLFAYQLWSGNDGLGSDYNSRQEVYNLSVPSYSQGVAVAGYITGHGWGAELENCAEFCNHSHHFLLQSPGSGAAGSRVSIDFWMAGSYRGCVAQVKEGVTPNQYGTWYLGRGGWCPGQVVPLLSWDFSLAACSNNNDSSSTIGMSCQEGRDSVWLGGGNITAKYWSYVNGRVYVPQPSGLGMGFGALIFRSLWLVVYAHAPYSPPACTVRRLVGSNASVVCLFTYQTAKAHNLSSSALASATSVTNTVSTNPPIDWIQIQVFRSDSNGSISNNSSEKNYTRMGYTRNYWNRKEETVIIADVVDVSLNHHDHTLYVYAINGVGRSSPCILHLAADAPIINKVANTNKIREAFIFVIEICLPIFFIVFFLLLCLTARAKRRSFRDLLFRRGDKHRAIGQQLDGEEDNAVEMIR